MTTATQRGRIVVRFAEPRWKTVAPNLSSRIRRAAQLALARADAGANSANLTILLTDDSSLHELNRTFRGKDKPTNVLSFPAAKGSGYLGDIAIAYGVAAHEAGEAGKPLLDHLLHLTVHGLLHLLGYDHEQSHQANAMEALEVRILSELGIPDPYRPSERAAA